MRERLLVHFCCVEPAQLQALLRLLDDPDPEVQAHIASVLRGLGEAAIPALEQEWLQTTDPATQQRIEQLLEELQLDLVAQALHAWRLEPSQPLLPALLQVARLRYPALDLTKYTHAYSRLVHTAWLSLQGASDPFEKVLALNKHLFVQERFQPERTRPQAARSYFLHELLDTRHGNSFSLSVLYYLIASELGMGVSLVGIGERYLVRYFDGLTHFYVDPYQRGSFLLAVQLQEVLRRVGLSDNLAHYRPLSAPYVILRLIDHLTQAYAAEGETSKARLYAQLRERLDAQLGGGTLSGA